jgi:copper chaperone CopZ
MKIKVRISNIGCEGCVRRIENILKEIEGIRNFKVELTTKSAEIEGDFDKDFLFKRLEDIGYPPEEMD